MPGRGPVPLGRRVLCRGGPAAGSRSGCRGGKHPPLRHVPGHQGSRPSSPPRPGCLRRGPRARGHRFRRSRFRSQPGPPGGPGPAGPPPGGGRRGRGRPRRRRRSPGRRPTPAPGPGPGPSPPRRSLQCPGPGTRAGKPGAGGAAQGGARCRGPTGAEAGAGEAGPQARRSRAQKAAAHLLEDVNEILELPASQIAWVEGPEHGPVLRVAPIDVGDALLERLWRCEDAPTAVITSATIPPHLGERLGLPAGSYDELDVGSPFCYPDQALLYCPVHLPDPRAAGSRRPCTKSWWP